MKITLEITEPGDYSEVRTLSDFEPTRFQTSPDHVSTISIDNASSELASKVLDAIAHHVRYDTSQTTESERDS